MEMVRGHASERTVNVKGRRHSPSQCKGHAEEGVGARVLDGRRQPTINYPNEVPHATPLHPH